MLCCAWVVGWGTRELAHGVGDTLLVWGGACIDVHVNLRMKYVDATLWVRGGACTDVYVNLHIVK